MSRQGRGPTTAVVPLRDGHSGKTRLAGQFGPRERSRLVTVLARHVVSTLLTAGTVSRVLVVTSDPPFARRALPVDAGIEVVQQPIERPGLNPAVTLGHELAVAHGAGRLLVVHADLPLLVPQDIHALLEPDIPLTLAPDRGGTGTNALVLDAAVRAFAFRFGPGSRSAHTQQANDLNLRAATISRSGTSTDLDTPADWAALPQTVRNRLRYQLGSSGLAQLDQ